MFCGFCMKDKPRRSFLDHRRHLMNENNLHYDIIISPRNGFICDDCGTAMLHNIADSKILWPENVLV